MDIYAHNFESTKTLPKHATPMQMRQLHWQNPREDAVALSIDNKIVRLCSFRAQMSTCTPIHNISCLQCSVCVRACVHRCIHMQIQPVHLPVLWLFCFILSPQIEFCLYNICLLVPQSGNDWAPVQSAVTPYQVISFNAQTGKWDTFLTLSQYTQPHTQTRTHVLQCSRKWTKIHSNRAQMNVDLLNGMILWELQVD